MTEKIDSNVGYFMAGLAIGSLVGIFFAPKSGQGTREYLSQKVKEGSKHARKKARELSERADDLVERGRNWSIGRKNKLQRNWKTLAKRICRRNRKRRVSRWRAEAFPGESSLRWRSGGNDHFQFWLISVDATMHERVVDPTSTDAPCCLFFACFKIRN